MENDEEVSQMGDCTNCRFDRETATCKQGHYRSWTHELAEPSVKIPIQDCHAWKEKEKEECPCEGLHNHYPGLIEITCLKCWRKIQ
jgi:hypothetical protein